MKKGAGLCVARFYGTASFLSIVEASGDRHRRRNARFRGSAGDRFAAIRREVRGEVPQPSCGNFVAAGWLVGIADASVA